MLSQFEQFIKVKSLFTPDDRLLLTISGGIDSVVLAKLCYIAGFNFGIAHCNFQLRGEESEGDQEFVEALAINYKVPFYVTRFSTKDYSKANGLSTQMAARNLRYEWFEQIRRNEKYDYIVTAHHQDDLLETILMNLTRGTGLAGLHGIAPKNGPIVRPMLFATRQNIEDFVKQNSLPWREDSSNASNDYVRNRLRHEVIPILRDINPQISAAAFQLAERVQTSEEIIQADFETSTPQLISHKEGQVWINKALLASLPGPVERLHYYLAKYGFTYFQSSQILQQRNQSVGKQFFSSSHQLVNDRVHWVLTTVNSPASSPILLVNPSGDLAYPYGHLQWEKEPISSESIIKTSAVACLDFDTLTFPLCIRPWRNGDWFCPSGMKGKRKKVSDFLVDSKIPRNLKPNVWVLESGGEIAWLIGFRIDQRFITTTESTTILRLRHTTSN